MDYETYLKTKYSKYSMNLYTDTTTIFTNLKTNNTLLTQKDIDKYITKIIAGKTLSYLNKYRYWKSNYANGYHHYTGTYIYGEFLIESLTDRHVLTKTQVDKILDNMTCSALFVWKWVDNLIKLNYEFTSDQLQKMATRGYKISIGMIMKKQDATMDDIYALCNTVDLNLNDITTVCKKYKLAPDNTCFSILLNNYSKTTKIPIDKYLDILLENNFKPNSETIGLAIPASLHTYGPSTIQKMISNGAIFDASHLESIYTKFMLVPKSAFNELENFTEFAIKHNIVLTQDHFKKLVHNTDNYIIQPPAEYESRINLYNLFLEKHKININMPELCDYVCQLNDEKLFSYLVEKKLFVATENSILFACRNGSKYIIENLANMKILANKKCAINLHVDCSYSANKKTTEIINLLIMAGMLVDYETIDILYSKGYLFPDITPYGLEYGDELYYIIHKNQSIIEVNARHKNEPIYLQKFYKKLVEFRKLFAVACLGVEEIENQIKKDGLEPDMFCYDNAILNQPIRNWLENKYNFKPTLLSLSRIDTFANRRDIISQYFNDSTKCHMDVNIMKLYIASDKTSMKKSMAVVHDTTDGPIAATPKVATIATPKKQVTKKIKIKGKNNTLKENKN